MSLEMITMLRLFAPMRRRASLPTIGIFSTVNVSNLCALKIHVSSKNEA